MIAAKQMDPVMGIDIHIIQPPGPVPPLPIPHPFIGMVLDPVDCMPMVGATIMVNGMPRATAGTGCKNIPPHIPIGGTFIKPPGNEGEVFMGSATVLADGSPLSFMAVPVLSCSDVGMPPPPRPTKKGSPASLMLPTTVLMAIPMGQIVMVGGPPTIDMMAMAMKIGMAGLGKAFKKLKKTKAMKKASDTLHDSAASAMNRLGVPPSARNRVHRGICSVTGHPVDIASGKVFTEQVDIEIPGPIPFKWERVWYSTSVYNGPLGYGWHHNYDIALLEDHENDAVAIRMSDGRSVPFPKLEIGDSYFSRQEKLSLHRDEKGYYLRDIDRLSYRFKSILSQEPERQLLAQIKNDAGSHIQFFYNDQGHLTKIIDSAGRTFSFTIDQTGRFSSIIAPHPDKKDDTFPVVRYEYDWEGNLVKVLDAFDQFYEFEYRNHLLIREANRNKLNFYFEYDGMDQNARCIHTWGDGGIYDHKITYAGGLTIVEDSLGHNTSHFHDGAVVHKMIDEGGGEHLTVFNEYFEIVEEIDPLGRKSQYNYDEYGNRTVITYPDGSQVQLIYEDNLLISAIDQNGGQWKWAYDMEGKLILHSDCIGREIIYTYDKGHLSAITTPDQATTYLTYDSSFNIVKIVNPNLETTSWEYDLLGRNTSYTDAQGNIVRKTLNLLGQATLVKEKDGNQRVLDYDPEGNIISMRDTYEEILYQYQGMGTLKAQIRDGKKIEFLYDTEERLIGVVNESGYTHRYDLDPLGNVELETDYENIKRYYKRDSGGQITSILRDNGTESKLKYDLAGRIIEVIHSNNEWEKYTFRADGKLMSAINESQEVHFTRDELGRILTETQGKYEVSSQYNIMGHRINVQSSLGATIDFQRNAMGDITRVVAVRGKHESTSSQENDNSVNDFWEAIFSRDKLGLEIGRTINSNVTSNWIRDNTGRPLRHDVTLNGKRQRTQTYSWNANNRLSRIEDNFSGNSHFDHDPLGRLISAKYGDGTYEYRVPDIAGNIYKTLNQSDRTYSPSGQVLESEGTKYQYDSEGNVVKKTEADGKSWSYMWNAAGMLKSVVRPDGKQVDFSYDALGRRISKMYEGRKTLWIWDRDVLLHEWVEVIERETETKPKIRVKNSGNELRIRRRNIQNEPTTSTSSSQPEAQTNPKSSLITWVFEADSYTPIAKLTEQHQYSIICDHVGTPQGMYDEKGEIVWASNLSIYGEVQNLTGNKTDCPFRYPGQYEDAETGLHYNRFRYYDCHLGSYISQDPIGLIGGLRYYGYVSDPLFWVDVYGLKDCASRRDAFRSAKRDSGIPTGQHPSRVERVPMTDRNGNRILDENNQPVMSREYHYDRSDGREIVIQEHSAGHQFGEGGVGDQGPHFNVRPAENTRTGSVPGTDDHYSW